MYHPPGPCYEMLQGLDFWGQVCQIRVMKKTTLDLSAILASYTAQVKADEAHRQAIREGRLPAPQPTTVWEIGDRH